MIKCKKHQWDYVMNKRIGPSEIVVYNPMYAIWVCPYCNHKKKVKIEKALYA